MKWALEENLTGATDTGRVGTPAGSRGSQRAFFAQEEDIAALAALVASLGLGQDTGARDLFAYVLLPWERHSHLCRLHR